MKKDWIIAAVILVVSFDVFARTEFVVPDYERWPAFTDIHTQVSNAIMLCTGSSIIEEGDIVTIKEGDYTLPDDAVTKGNEEYAAWYPQRAGITLRGDPAAGRDKVIIRGGAKYAAFYGRNVLSRLENITFVDFTNETYGAARGYNTSSSSTFTISNCVFKGFTSAGGGGAKYATVQNCLFTNCYSSGNGGGVYGAVVCDSVFIGNTAKNYGGGCSGCSIVTNCVFVMNKVTTYDGGALYGCNRVIDCCFTNNYATRWGGAVYGSTLLRCDFGTGNFSGDNNRATLGGRCNYSDCVFTGDQNNELGTFERCVFSNMTVHPVAFRTGGTGYMALTNCLIANCTVNDWKALIYASSATNCSVVNCTFVGNNTGTGALIEFTGGQVENGLFYDNYRTVNTATTRDDACFSILSGGTFAASNNCYGVSLDGFAYPGGGNFQCADPKFMGARDLIDPYALQLSSQNVQVREGGHVESWMADSTDLAGNPRLRDDKVGVGCYECWQNWAGLLMSLR